MRNQYGAKGYGWYWIIVEMLREQDDYKIEIKDYLWNALAMELQCEPNKAEDFVKDCIDKFELFNSDDDKFWSESLLRRMEIKDKKKKKKAEAGRKGAKARWNNDNDKQKDSTANGGANGTAKADASDTNGKNGKGKESKVKEKKEKEIYKDIVSHLNKKAGREFKYTTNQTQKFINGRLDEGYDLDDFKEVIDKKVQDWKGDNEMEKYLRPQTLFRPSKFEDYLNEPWPNKEEETDVLDDFAL